MAEGRHLENVFGYNLASYRPFWADFCKIKQNGITEKGHVKLTVNIANFDFFCWRQPVVVELMTVVCGVLLATADGQPA